jgi:hypothetical protein
MVTPAAAIKQSICGFTGICELKSSLASDEKKPHNYNVLIVL